MPLEPVGSSELEQGDGDWDIVPNTSPERMLAESLSSHFSERTPLAGISSHKLWTISVGLQYPDLFQGISNSPLTVLTSTKRMMPIVLVDSQTLASRLGIEDSTRAIPADEALFAIKDMRLASQDSSDAAWVEQLDLAIADLQQCIRFKIDCFRRKLVHFDEKHPWVPSYCRLRLALTDGHQVMLELPSGQFKCICTCREIDDTKSTLILGNRLNRNLIQISFQSVTSLCRCRFLKFPRLCKDDEDLHPDFLRTRKEIKAAVWLPEKESDLIAEAIKMEVEICTPKASAATDSLLDPVVEELDLGCSRRFACSR